MAFLSKELFSFTSQGLPEDTFGVVNFRGVEGLSQCYRFEIRLVATRQDLDLAEVMKHSAVFTIHREDDEIPFHGILAQLEIHQAFKEFVFYRAVLVPRLWWLKMTHHNQVFLNLTPPQIIAAVLEDGGLTALDYEFRLGKDYPVREYVCQYQESHFDFVCRWMEQTGMYYFFEQTQAGEKLVITDTRISHQAMPQGRSLTYAPVSGLDEAHREEVIRSWIGRQTLAPKSVTVKDYNYRTPSVDLTGRADVAPEQGLGELYFYGDHFLTPEEAEENARTRADGLLCRQQQFLGRGTVPFLRPGYLFDLTDHFRDDFNQEYLTTQVQHEGNQAGYLVAGLKEALSRREERQHYQNQFVAMPASLQFRPERITPRARFHGAVNARIDASGSGKYAEIDEFGRYKIVLPFDLSGRKDGKASAWFRMMQPYGGSNHGLHFPLHKNTEVLLTFIDGDPDRPIIAGTVPNPENPSLVKDANQTMNMLTTAGQNKIHIEDQEGRKRLLFQSPTSNSWFRMGAANDPPGVGSGSSGSGSNGNSNSDDDQPATQADIERLQEEIDELKTENQELKETLATQEEEIQAQGEQEDQAREQMEAQIEAMEKEVEDLEAEVKGEEGEDGLEPWKHGEEGFALSTEGSWNAGIGQEMVLEIGGNYTKVVVGGEMYEIGGVKQETVVGGSNETIIGGVADFLLGGEFKMVIGFTKELKLNHKIGLKDEEKHLHREITELGEKYTSLLAEHKALSEKSFALSKKILNLTEEHSLTAQKVTNLSQTTEQMDESITAVANTVNRAYVNLTRVTDRVSLVENQRQLMAQEITNLTEKQTNMSQKITTLAEDADMVTNTLAFVSSQINMV